MAGTYSMVQTPQQSTPTRLVPQQRGYSALGLGDTAHFWDGSETYWQPTIEALDTVWNTHDTIPVNRDKYLPEDLNLIAEDGRSRYQSRSKDLDEDGNLKNITEGDDYFKTFGFSDKTATNNNGIYLAVPFRRWDDRLKSDEKRKNNYNKIESHLNDAEKQKYRPTFNFDDRTDRPTVGIMDSGFKRMKFNSKSSNSVPLQSVGMHELAGHYYDNVIAGQDRLSASDIMKSYMTDPMHQENWTKESLQKQWMSDPKTAHLDLNDPENIGLRTLLMNRSHHGGVVNPREGFGEYISTALTDPYYKTVWSGPGTEGIPDNVKRYRLSNAEMFARAVGNTLRPQLQDEGFGIKPEGLDKRFVDSLATYLNSR